MEKIFTSTLMLAVFCMLTWTTKNCVLGEKPYDYQKQICCSGVVNDGNYSEVACCGTKTYKIKTEQCCYDESTVVPQKDGDKTLTCCGGKGVAIGYNEICCAGVVQSNPTVSNPSDTFACCNDKAYITSARSCCNGVLSDDAAQVLQCCNGVSYDSTKNICCNETTVVSVPASVQVFQYSCCGIQGYDTQKQVCDDSTDTILDKPPNAPCPNQYNQVCGGKVLNPNQQCCNDQAFYPPTVWIDYGQGDGSGYLGSQAFCCPGGKGIVQDPSKESCCIGGTNPILPIDLPTQTCCGDKIIDMNVDTCCNGVVQPGPANFQGCCGDKSYLYATQICCGVDIVDKSAGYNSCCYPVLSLF